MPDELEPREHKDTQGYYRALGLDHVASGEQIQLAYEMLTEVSEKERGIPMAEVERAYRILSNPVSRVSYDKVQTAPVKFVAAKRLLDDVRILVVTVVLLVGAIAFVWYPLYGDRFRSFSAGDRLVDLAGHEFGVVVDSSAQHSFPTGIFAEAYLIELEGTSELRWFPADDIRTTCRKAE